MSHLQSAATHFETIRRRLFGVAYRIIGTAAEAEEVVQEAWLRLQTADPDTVQDMTAFLMTVTARLALNVAQSARAQRESYIGPWLPEPVDTTGDPFLGAARGEALSVAILRLLEELQPTERAAYVLREAFDYSHADIAAVLNITEQNARQLSSRARKHVQRQKRLPVSAEQHDRLLRAFITAAHSGNMQALQQLFTDDIVSISDGGGVVVAARVPVTGSARVAQVIAAFHQSFWADADMQWTHTNGQLTALVLREAKPVASIALEATEHGIHQLLWTFHPDKLRTFAVR